MASVAVDMWVDRAAGNQAGTALAVAVDTVVADMVLVAVGCPVVDTRSSLFPSRAYLSA